MMLLGLFVMLFTLNNSTAEASENNEQNQLVINSEDITIKATPLPYKVWYSTVLNLGNNPPATYYIEHRYSNKMYRGWLTRTNKTDTHAHTVYEGYLYRPDVTLPIPSRLQPQEQ